MFYLSQTLLLVLLSSVCQPSALLQDRSHAARAFREQEDASPSACQFDRMDASGLNLKSFARKISNRRKPLLLYNVDNWRKLTSDMTEESLLARYGDRLAPVEAVTSRPRRFRKLGKSMQAFRTYILRGEGSSTSKIVYDLGLSSNFSRSLWREKGGYVPKFLKEIKALPVVSLGALGTGAGMHQHQEAWLLSLHGRKAWWIGEKDAGEENFYGSLSPCQHFGTELPPRYSFCVQQPGEIIYLPNSSWHATCNIDDFVLGIGAQGRVDEWPPLMQYVSNRDANSVEKLLRDATEELDASRMLDSASLATALDYALALGYDDIAERLASRYHTVLMERRLPLHRVLPTSLMHAAARAESIDLAEMFRGGGYSPNEPFHAFSNETAFDRSAERGNLELLRRLVPSYEKKFGSTLQSNRKAALFAAESGHIEILKELKALSIDVRSPGENGLRPIHAAAAGGHIPVAMALIGKGRLHIEAVDDNGNSPMHVAAEQGHTGMLQFFLDHGAQLDINNTESLQPLHIAVEGGHTPAVSYLLEQRADVMARGQQRMTPLHFCASVGHADVANLLLERGAEVDVLGGQPQRSALQEAAMSGAASVAKLLLGRRADVARALEKGGDTNALNVAAAQGHKVLVELLIAHAPISSFQALADDARTVAAKHDQGHIVDFLSTILTPGRDVASEL